MKEIILHADEVEMEAIARAENVSIQWLIGEGEDVNYYMRRFTFGINGRMPLHRHDNFEHEEYILKGKLKATVGDEEYVLNEGNFLFIPKNVSHSYENIGKEYAQFLCIIPAIKDRHTELLET